MRIYWLTYDSGIQNYNDFGGIMDLQNAEKAAKLLHNKMVFGNALAKLKYIDGRFDNSDVELKIRGESFFVMNRALFMKGLIDGYQEIVDKLDKEISEM